MNYESYDKEGRVMRVDFETYSVISVYMPSGSSGESRQSFKMTFLEDFHSYISELIQRVPNLIIAGDYNICHKAIDIHNPQRNQNTSGFLPEEREWMSKWLNSGFVDAFRQIHPEKVEYSWWSYRAGARKNNKGWRIDYQSVSQPIADKIKDAYQMGDAVHSDHCPVYMEINL